MDLPQNEKPDTDDIHLSSRFLTNKKPNARLRDIDDLNDHTKINYLPLRRKNRLHEAINLRSINKIDKAISKGYDVNERSTTTGLTPLECAVLVQMPILVSHLLSRGANPNVIDANGSSALYLALLYDYQETAIILLHGGARIYPNPPYPFLGLDAASKNAHITDLLVKQGCDPNGVNHAGFAPLHFAVINGNEDVLIYLLKLGVKKDVRSQNGQETPLEMAIRTNNSRAIELLQ